jgi:hypothetical protein
VGEFAQILRKNNYSAGYGGLSVRGRGMAPVAMAVRAIKLQIFGSGGTCPV